MKFFMTLQKYKPISTKSSLSIQMLHLVKMGLFYQIILKVFVFARVSNLIGLA